MSIDLNKLYGLKGSQVLSLKSYIDSHGGGGGSEILYGPDEPDDSQGTDGQLYVVIPELKEDDYSTIKITWVDHNPTETQQLSGLNSMTLSQFNTSITSIKDAICQSFNYESSNFNLFSYRQNVYYIEDYDDWPSITLGTFDNAISKVQAKFSQLSSDMGIECSFSYDSSTGTYTINEWGTITTYSTWDSAYNEAHTFYEQQAGYASWTITFYSEIYYAFSEWGEGYTIASSLQAAIYSTITNTEFYDPNTYAYYTLWSIPSQGSNSMTYYLKGQEGEQTKNFDNDVQGAIDKYNDIIDSVTTLSQMEITVEKI